MKNTIQQFVRYATVGLVSNAIGYLAYLALTAIVMAPTSAMTLIYGVGVAQSFWFNKRWSFRHDGTHGPAFVRYCAAYGLGYVVNLAALVVLVGHRRYPHQLVQGTTMILLAMMLFALQKFWVFAPVTQRAES